MRKSILLLLLMGACSFGCSSSTDDNGAANPPTGQMYFPPIGGTAWETTSLSDLNWHEEALQPLRDYLEAKNSKSFMILVNGKIVEEAYFSGHSATSGWYWASAGKTLTSTTFGIAEQNGLVNRGDKVAATLGTGWTSETLAQENKITNFNLLTMTSGLDDVANGDCVTPGCLTYKADANTRWAYHNVYVKLQDVIAVASGQTFQDYFTANLRDKIGMSGTWFNNENNVVYWSDTRSMARFGLLMLNKGKWDGQTILNESYFNDATSTSQNINQSYGYLWWLNGKSSFHLPQSQFEFQGPIIPAGPSDMFMALGKNDQKIYIIPSKNMVVVRMGNAADDVNPALSDFDQKLWEKINALTE